MEKNFNINIKRLIRGDKTVWDAFVERFSSVIYSAVLKVFLAHSPNVNEWDIKEVVQDVFLRLLKNNYHLLKTYNPAKSSLVTWLTIIARSSAIDFLRRSRLQIVPLTSEIDIAVKPQHSLGSSIDIPSNLLSPRQKLILHLIFDKEKDTSEIAELLGIDVQTVRSCKHKALNKLRKFFKVKD